MDIRPVSASAGARIRLYRKIKGYTLVELAERIHKSKATLSKYETGEIALDVDTLWEIASALEVSVGQLLIDAPPTISESPGAARLGNRRVYVYFYDGRVKAVVRNLLEVVSEEDGEKATFYNDLDDFRDPKSCRNLYFGRAERYDTITNFLFRSQSNRMERLNLYVVNPFDMTGVMMGMLTGISEYSIMPVSIKCAVSNEELREDEELLKLLTISQDDIKRTRAINMFAVSRK